MNNHALTLKANREDISRRSFIKSGIAVSGMLGLSSFFMSKALAAEKNFLPEESSPSGNMPCFDIHAHYVPAAYRQVLSEHGQAHAEADGLPIPEWSFDEHLAMMDRLNIATAMLSIAAPHFHFGDSPAAARLARKVNEEGAMLVSHSPNRFGLLASLPLPDVDNSLEELEYAFDILHADGIKLPTNSLGVYLGDTRLDPIFAELSRRKAVVVLHPVKPSSVPSNVLDGCPIPVVEYLIDTTRTVTNLILNGTLQRYPDIKLVIPHAGAFLPSLTDRLDGLKKILKPKTGVLPDVRESLHQIYYDLAGFPVPLQLQALLQMTDPDHLLFGSDWPYAFEALCVNQKQQLLTTGLLTAELQRAIFHDNALALFPRLKQV